MQFALRVYESPEAFRHGTTTKPTPTLVLGGRTTRLSSRPASTSAAIHLKCRRQGTTVRLKEFVFQSCAPDDDHYESGSGGQSQPGADGKGTCRSRMSMEDFLASPGTPRETALENLRNSDVMILVIGFKAGSLLPDGSGSTYTSAEYDELLRLVKVALVFVKRRSGGGSAFRCGAMRNERSTAPRICL